MSRIIKVKTSDIINIVKLISEQGYDDYDTRVQPEELPQEPDFNPEDFQDDENTKQLPKILIGKDKNGRIGIVDTQTGDLLGLK